MHRILIGGDQLTAARARSAQKAKLNAQTPSKRLEGLVSVVEDWHTKANLLGVSIVCKYSMFVRNTSAISFDVIELTVLLNNVDWV